MSGHDEKHLSEEQHQRLCAWLFGELEGEEARAFEAELEASQALQEERARLEATIGLVQESLPAEALSDTAREALVAAAEGGAGAAASRRSPFTFLRGGGSMWRAAAGLLIVVGAASVLLQTRQGESVSVVAPAIHEDSRERVAKLDAAADEAGRDRALGRENESFSRESEVAQAARDDREALRAMGYAGGEPKKEQRAQAAPSPPSEALIALDREVGFRGPGDSVLPEAELDALGPERLLTEGMAQGMKGLGYAEQADEGSDPDDAALAYERASGAAPSQVAGAASRTQPSAIARSRAEDTATDVPRRLSEPASNVEEQASKDGFNDQIGAVAKARAASRPAARQGRSGGGPGSDQAVVRGVGGGTRVTFGGGRADGSQPISPAQAPATNLHAPLQDARTELQSGSVRTGSEGWFVGGAQRAKESQPQRRLGATENTPVPAWSVEELDAHCRTIFERCRVYPQETPHAMFFRCWGDNPFEYTALDRLSTFSVDVDTASYTLARRYLTDGYLPTKEQVRTEEFVNYFDADAPAPSDGSTFAIGLEMAPSAFYAGPDEGYARLLRVSVRGKDMDRFDRQPLALTFVVDVSGSMKGERIGLVKQSLALVSRELSTTDSISLVTFNNEARIVSPMISAASRSAFENELVGLSPGGGTNVEAGLRLGYELASAALTPHAVNRVILLSDGVGNIGHTDQRTLLSQVERYREQGIYLNAVGVGMGNHNDAFLEQLADRGDGLCHYVDRLDEARRVFVEQFTQTLQPIARDVKIQVEFDPEQVEQYRLLGYENRSVADKDFRNDAIDAGEVNAGHQVVALYELILAAGDSDAPLATVRLRWKPPFAVDRGDLDAAARESSERALEMERSITAGDALATFQQASFGYRRDVLVAQFAEVLRQSVHARPDSFKKLIATAAKLNESVRDPQVTELVSLMVEAKRLMDQRGWERDRLQRAIDELCRLHYLEARREQLEGEEERSSEEQELGREAEELSRRLEEQIREILRERHRVGSVDQETPEALRDVGYSDER